MVNVLNIQHFSLDDGPGIRTVVFFKGCPLDCAWCHNPEGKSTRPLLAFDPEKCVLCGACVPACARGAHTVEGGRHLLDRTRCVACFRCAEVCPAGALERFGREMTAEEIMDDLAKDDLFFGENGGVTFSGGEPFLQFEALRDLLRRCKEKRYHVCIETSGYTAPENLRAAAAFTDLFLYDCKVLPPEKHRELTGVSNARILQNLTVLDEENAAVILRCPFLPQINDSPAHAEGLAALADAHPCVKSVEIMPYHPLGLSKAKQISARLGYENPFFADKEDVAAFVRRVRSITGKPVSSS